MQQTHAHRMSTFGIVLGASLFAPSMMAAPANTDEIAALVEQLGDASFSTRTVATRRLAVIGMPAADALRQATDSACLETSLRAQALLRDFENRLFAGMEVELSFSKRRIRWDEPVDLVITLTNPTAYAARVPLDIEPPSEVAPAGDARQVGDMLDVADLLRVRDRKGNDIAMMMDDIALDPDVDAAVRSRLTGGPIGVVGPGQRATLRVRAFNRGWARFRLLDAGSYTALLEYVPPWVDPVLAERRVGRVVSGEARLSVSEGAPAGVSRKNEVASVALSREGEALLVWLTNHTDQVLLVNRNIGPAAPFATGQWLWSHGDMTHEVAAGGGRGITWRQFDAKELVAVGPGERVELTRVAIAALRRSFVEAGADLDEKGGRIRFSYSNLCDRQWQARQRTALLGNALVPEVLQKPLPRRVLTIRQTSEMQAFPGAD